MKTRLFFLFLFLICTLSCTNEKKTDAITTFTPNPDGKHRYLKVTPEQAGVIRQYFIDLITRRPTKYQ